MTSLIRVGLLVGFAWFFDGGVASKNELMILYFINVVDDINKIEPYPTIGRLND